MSPIQRQPVNVYNNLVTRLDHHQNEDPDDQRRHPVKEVGQLSKIYQDLYLMYSRKERSLKPIIDSNHLKILISDFIYLGMGADDSTMVQSLIEQKL